MFFIAVLYKCLCLHNMFILCSFISKPISYRITISKNKQSHFDWKKSKVDILNFKIKVCYALIGYKSHELSLYFITGLSPMRYLWRYFVQLDKNLLMVQSLFCRELLTYKHGCGQSQYVSTSLSSSLLTSMEHFLAV